MKAKLTCGVAAFLGTGILGALCLYAVSSLDSFILSASAIEGPADFSRQFPLLHMLSFLIGVDFFNVVKLNAGDWGPFCLLPQERLVSWAVLFFGVSAVVVICLSLLIQERAKRLSLAMKIIALPAIIYFSAAWFSHRTAFRHSTYPGLAAPADVLGMKRAYGHLDAAVHLPIAERGLTVAGTSSDDLHITVSRLHGISLFGYSTSLEEVSERVAAEAQAVSSFSVFIWADKDLEWGRVSSLVDCVEKSAEHAKAFVVVQAPGAKTHYEGLRAVSAAQAAHLFHDNAPRERRQFQGEE